MMPLFSHQIMELPVPICHSEPWPTDLEQAEIKFSHFNEHRRALFLTHDHYAEVPRIQTWSSSAKDNKRYSSACLLWDAIQAYGLLGVLNWNNGIKTGAVSNIRRAACFFNAIAKKLLPRWNPACRQVADGKSFVKPLCLRQCYWETLTDICRAEIQRLSLVMGLSKNNQTSALARLAVAGWKPLLRKWKWFDGPVADLLEKQRNRLRSYSLVLWARTLAKDNDPATYGKCVRAMESAAKNGSIEGLGDLVTEAASTRQMNDRVYYSSVPTAEIDDEILNAVNPYDIEIKFDALACFV